MPQQDILSQDSDPVALDESQLALAQTGGTAGSTQTPTMAQAAAEPVLHPPGTAGAAMSASMVGAWNTRKVLALYMTQHSRNGWAYLDSVGWRRFATTNDSAHLALSMIASTARTTGATVQARDEADNQIHEIYCW
ncbi:MAG: hypothetical protein JXA67_18590 [Micromonosporaceae bacterium]|nr:hypothetical protein [Micromonosporaceae bacterium]